MRKVYTAVSPVFLFSLLTLVLSVKTEAQTTVSSPAVSSFTYSSATADGAIVFGIKNTNLTPITITGISHYVQGSFTATFGLWYHTTAVTGAPTAISLANGWLNPANVPVTTTSGGMNPTFSGLSITIPAGATYRFAISGPPFSPYYGGAGLTPNLYSGGGLQIFVQDNANSPGYGGAFPGPPANTPRSFLGSVTFMPSNTCTDPPTPGTAIAPAIACIGSTFNLDLSGNSIGTGQMYQWQSSPDNSTWTNLGVATNSPLFPTTVSLPTYFRAQVTCGATTLNSASVLVDTSSSLNGVYTINSLAPAAGRNFQSYSAAITKLTRCGVTGPVTFNVISGSGPYNEQITIPAISGASATNTITFKGNLTTITSSTTTTGARSIITLNGADYITLDSLVIDATGGSFGWGVLLTGQADFNKITNCVINTSATNTTSVSYCPIAITGSLTTPTTSGNNGNNNQILNNTTSGGYYGIVIYGNSAADAQNLNNTVSGNKISDTYSYSVYSAYQSGALISGNEMTRPTRTASTTTAGVFLTTGNINCRVEKNRIHHMFAAFPTSTSTMYGVYVAADGTAAAPNKVINNLIYSPGGNGIVYGIYNTAGPYMQAYHNTISIDDQAATTGAAYGLYQTTAAVGIDYKNNVVNVTRSGTGTKRCVYFVTTTSTITSNNNNLFMNVTGGTNNHLGQWGTTNYTTFANWQTANSSAYDQQSINLDPQFTNPGTGDYSPTNVLTNNTGTNVGVTTDILGNPRSNTTPDAGAYEFSFIVAGINMSAEALVTPAISTTGCYSASETVTIRIRNNGSATLDMAVNPVTVTVNVTGAATQLLTTTINTGTLASNGTLDVVLPGTLNMSAAGIYTFNAFTTVTGDVNPADNAMQSADRTKVTVSPGVVSVTPENFCVSQTTGPVLTTDGAQTGHSGLQWQQSTTSGSGFVNIPSATTVPYTVGTPLTQTMYYRLVASCGGVTQPSNEVVVNLINPQVTGTTPGSRCGPGSVTLSATGTAGTLLNWYQAATGGTPLNSGNSFVTPSIPSTTTYYVGASTGSGGNVSAGLANAITTTGYTLEAGLFFDATTDFTLEGVYVYPMGTGAGTATLALQNSSGTTVQSIVANLTGTATPWVKTYVPLNWNVPTGTNYRLVMLSRAGLVSGLLRESGSTWGTYPITTAGVVSITNGKCCPDATSTSYYYFYDWKITAGCESPRTAVTATIGAAATLNASQDISACNNATTTLTIESNQADYTSYIWSPTTGLFTDAAGTIPYTGTSATTVYAKTATPGQYKFYVNATNSSTSCANIDSVTVTVLPASLSIAATQSMICGSGSTTLSVPAGEYGTAIQWYSSPDGISYSLIPGATSIQYISPVLLDTTYFKLEIKNGSGTICLQPTIRIDVGGPTIVNTAPATRCGPGSVTVGATGTAGSTVRWYANASGGSPLATGNNYTTNVSANTTFYAEASEGGGSGSSPILITEMFIGDPDQLEIQNVTGTPVDVTGWKVAISNNYTNITAVNPNIQTLSGIMAPGQIMTWTDGGGVGDWGSNMLWNPGAFPTFSGWAAILDNNNNLVDIVFTNWPAANIQGASITIGTATITVGTQWSGNGIDITTVASTNSVSRQGGVDNNSGSDFQIISSSLSSTNPGLLLPYTGGGCSSVRVPVLASVFTAPALSVAKDTLVCNNAITTLTVESNVADYTSYIWSPMAGLYTDASATIPYTGGSATTLYAKINTAGATKYYINSTNSSTLCSNIDSVTVTVLPGTLAINATTTALCQSGSVTLSIPAGVYGTALQWYSSPDGVTYSPIAGATSTSYVTPTLSTTVHYKLEIKNAAGAVCLQPTITINVGTPLVLGTTPASRCGPGTVTLGATVNPVAVANWYAGASGGLPIFTGSSFTTPIINNTTTYYVASRVNTAGAPATTPVGAGATTSATYSNPFYSLWSNTHNQHIIRASEMVAAGISGGNITALALDITAAGTLPMIDLSVKMGTTTATDMTAFVAPAFTTVYTSPSLMPVVGINTLTFSTPFYWDGVSNIVIEICHGNAGSTATMSRTAKVDNTSYVSTIHTQTSAATAAATQCANTTTNLITYSVRPQFYFTFQALCEGPRVPVIATVNPAPAFSVARDSLICSGGITALSVETNVADFNSYTWSPTAGLYTDPAATIPYAGGSATTLYAKVVAGGIYKYYINALNTTSNCTGLDSVKLTVLPASLAISATRAQICGSGNTVLSLPAGEYGTAAIQWYTSPDGIAYTSIPGASGITYSTPVLTSDTYYKVEIKNGAGAVCIQPTIRIAVGIPDVIATAPAVRCDPGSVTIGATPGPAGATINWYSAATGGLPIATGNTYITPVIPATTTYYAASSFGFSTVNTGRLAPQAGAATVLTTYGLDFTLTQAITLNSVEVISTTGTSITVSLYSSGGAAQLQTTGPRTVPINSTNTINLGWTIAPGTYRLIANGMTGNFIRENSTITWPIALSNVGQINGFVSAITGAVTTSASYYWFYNWSISTGCESARVPVTATINGTITIDADPVDRELCSTGQNVVFSVSATGAISNYQWRKNGVNIPGATSSTYTIPSASAGDVGAYDVIVSGPCSSDTSTTADLTIVAPTLITTEPVAQSVCPGGSVTFTTAATGGGSLGYQWRKNGINIPGAYGTTFTIASATAGDVGNYDVVVTGGCNNDTSVVAPLVIGNATLVTTQPVAQTACTGNNVTFTTAGSGSGTLSYQWRKGGVAIPGATSSTYTITGVATTHAGIYDVVITGNCGSATSNVASLVVNAGTAISVHPVAQSTCIGTNVIFTVAASGSGTINYQWRKGGVNIGGATSSSYTINGVTVADIGTYDVVISGSCGSLTSNPAALTISAPGTWIGVQNSNWNNAANWCGGIPTPVTDVIIPNYAPNMPVLTSGPGSARNITINAGATLTVGTDGVLNLYGNLTATGAFTATSGTIAFRGATAQTVPAFTALNVIMNGTGGFTLAGQTTITGALTLTSGHITLGANNLSLATSSTGSTSSHIITNGTGNVIVAAMGATSSRIVPVGISAASYTPATLVGNAGHVTDNMTVRVVEHVLANGTTGNQVTSYVVDRTWLINEVVPGGSNVNVTLQWNESDELQLFGRNECYVMHYTGGSWSTITETPAAGANPYTQTRTNITTFSPFAVQTDPLPNAVTGLFPNPTNSTLNIVVRTNQPEQLTMEIYDAAGKLMMTQRESVRFGGTLISIDVSRLITGTYILKVSTPKDREFFVRKFVKVN